MSSKIQGEGDYESARRYNRHTTDSVRKSTGRSPSEVKENSQELQNAEQRGKQRAKEMQHDRTDAELMKQPVDRRSAK